MGRRRGRIGAATFEMMASVGALLLGALAMTGQVSAIEATLPVARIAIYPGDTITMAMIEDRRLVLAADTREQMHASREALIGKVARRTLLPGQTIPRHAVREPDLVRSGRPVTLLFQAGGLHITSRGLALQAGTAGEVISAQNQDSGIVVRGTVQPDGTVRIGD